MRNFILCFTLFSCCTTAAAQVTHVYYDAFYDSTRYEQNGRIIDQPLMKKGSRIVVHVTNYNDYLYELTVATQEENYSVPAGGPGELLGGGAGGLDILQNILGSGGGGGGNLLTNLLPGGDGFGFSAERTETAGLSREAKNQVAQLELNLKEMKTLEAEIAERDEYLQTLIQRKRLDAFMQTEVIKLRNDASLAPNTSRKLMLEYLENLLEIDGNAEYKLDDLLKQANARGNFLEGVKNYETDANRLAAKAREINFLAGSLRQYQLPEQSFLELDNTLASIDVRTGELQAKVAELNEQAPVLLEESMQELATTRYLYEELKDHKFERQLTVYPEGDVTTLRITLTPKGEQNQNLPVLTASPIKVNSFGGLQINASVGISFASYFDAPKDYLVLDGKLFGDELDAFAPIVTSYIHFYGQSKGNVSLAGTLGLGLDLGGNGSAAGLSNYFLGPSLIIGKGQRIVLTSGLMGGKADRLARGLREGDMYSEQTIPLKSVYELGFFVGVSFNVLGK
jgi:hypothetical protein